MTDTTLSLEQALQQAVAHHRAGRLPEAERLYRAILQIQPQHPDANHNLGVLAVSVNQVAVALPLFQIALEAHPQQEQYWLSYADALLRAGQPDNARQVINAARTRGLQGEALKQFEAKLPDQSIPCKEQEITRTADDALASAIAYREAGRYQDAIAWLDQYLATNPNDSSAMGLLVHVLLLDKQDARAAAVLQQALTRDEKSPAVQRNLARVLLKQNQPVAALQAAEIAQQTDPNNFEGWLVLAAALGANQRDSEALPLVERALQARPSYAEAFANRAMIRLRAKDKVGALADIEKALELKPHLGHYWQLVASLRYETKDLPGAIKAMHTALANDPANIDLKVTLGEFLRQNSEVAAAIELLKSAVGHSPNNAAAWVNYGTALQQAKRNNEAKTAYQKALAINPQSAAIASNLGALARDEGNWEEALAYFNQALVIQPGHAVIHANRAAALSALERYDEAEREARQALALDPSHVEAHLVLASTLTGRKQYDNARNQLAAIKLPATAGKTLRQRLANAHANLSLVQNRWHEAEEWLMQSLTWVPDDVKTLRQLAVVRKQKNDYEGALATLNQARGFAPQDIDTLLAISGLHIERERWAEAEDLARQAQRIKPDETRVLIQLSQILNEQNRYEDAFDLLQTVAERSQEDVSIQQAYANHFAHQRKWSDAESWLRRMLALKPNESMLLRQLAAVLDQQKRHDEAMLLYEQALSAGPDNVENLLAVASHHVLQQCWCEAEAVARRTLVINPDNIEARMQLGRCLDEQRRYSEAGEIWQDLARRVPEEADLYVALTNHFVVQEKWEQAEPWARKAVEAKPASAANHYNLGIILNQLVEKNEAAKYLHQALQIDPDLALAHVELANIEIDTGRFVAADDHIKKALAADPDSASAWALIPSLRKMTKADRAWFESAKHLLTDVKSSKSRIALLHALGKYSDDTQDYDTAFAYYREANELKNQNNRRYNPEEHGHLINILTTTHTREVVGQIWPGASNSQRPLFIVGMLRSGTSLLEQILASHPDTFGAGELEFWNGAVKSFAQESLKAEYQEAMLSEVAEGCLANLERHSATAQRVVDKMPGNFHHLGFIHATFPQARILHTMRNPVDTCLSIYFQNFGRSHDYANDLEDLALYYRQYHRLMDHWRSVLPKEIFLDVPYEALVEDQEGWSRKIIDFIGLKWDDRCLDFYKTERKVGTASNWQARQPIYKSSKERWRNYEKFVGPLLPLLELYDPTKGQA